MKKGKYLITGCAGFIGANLVEQLRKKYNLILVDDLSEGSVSSLPKQCRKKIIKEKMPIIKAHNPLSDTYFTIFIFLVMIKYYPLTVLLFSILFNKSSL